MIMLCEQTEMGRESLKGDLRQALDIRLTHVLCMCVLTDRTKKRKKCRRKTLWTKEQRHLGSNILYTHTKGVRDRDRVRHTDRHRETEREADGDGEPWERGRQVAQAATSPLTQGSPTQAWHRIMKRGLSSETTPAPTVGDPQEDKDAEP